MTRQRTSVVFGAALALLVIGAFGFSRPNPEPVQDIETMRAYLLDAFQRHKEPDVAYVNAMPDSAWRWAPTEGVRDYAQQMAHVTHDFFTPWRGDTGPSADSASYLNDKAVMVAQIEEGYDWALAHFGAMSTEELSETVEIFGGRRLPQWRNGTYWVEHAMWTRGSVVPYLRAQGVRPPGIRFFGE